VENYIKIPENGKKPQIRFKRGMECPNVYGENRLSVADAAAGFSPLADCLLLFPEVDE